MGMLSKDKYLFTVENKCVGIMKIGKALNVYQIERKQNNCNSYIGTDLSYYDNRNS